MKKVIDVLISLMVILVLAACTNGNSPDGLKEILSNGEAVRLENESNKTQGTEEVADGQQGIGKESDAEKSGDDLLDGEGMDVDTKILVAYFSCTGTTELVAEYAAGILGADRYEIVPKEPYTEADLAYYTNGRADQEQNDPNARPEISGSVENMDGYDIIILGYPIWHGQAPRIISTFLESYDFSGKTIIPFCTSHSSGIGSSADNLHALCSESAMWMDGKRFGGEVSKESVEEWIVEYGSGAW
ncbi:MAG: flavodoxin [Lachnospiraceae bacterium]|nr:flavodoxin [Lachnospiraceae bacterium]